MMLSLRVTIVWCLCFLLLGLAAISHLVGDRPPPEPVALVEFDPASVTSIRVGDERLERTTRGWAYVGESSWGASTAGPFLEVLRRARVTPDDEGTIEDPFEVRLETGGDPIVIELARTTLAGRGMVRRGDLVGSTTDELHRVVRSGLEGWRRRTLLDGTRPEEVRLESGATSVTLRRTGDRWSVLDPIAARASAPRVDALLEIVERLSFERFDEVTSDAPTATVTLEGRGRTQRVEILKAAGVGSARLIARATVLEEGVVVLGPVQGVIDGSGLDRLSMDPASYLPLTLDALPVEDIDAIESARGVSIRRTLDGWTRDGEVVADATAILRRLREAPARRIAVGAIEDPGATLSLRAGGPEVGTLLIGAVEGALLVTWNGITREYTGPGAQEVVEWATSF